MVAQVRAGASMRAVARTCRVALRTIQRWIRRAGAQRLDRVDWMNRPPVPRGTGRTPLSTENLVLDVRHELKTTSALGEFGADAIRRALLARGRHDLPSVRTIGRILERRGALDGQRRVRRPAPPRGWYLPEVAQGQAELEMFDSIEGLIIQGGIEIEVLTGLSLHGGLPAAWPGPPLKTTVVVEHLITHWHAFGLPDYAQFDNDTRFQGAHQHPDVVSRVMRLSLSLGITPVFVPIHEPAFQAALEAFNGRWQAKVWSRFHHASAADLLARSNAYLVAARSRAADRLAAAPRRRPFPQSWHLDFQQPPRGRLLFLRRTSDRGTVFLLGRTFGVDPHWTHRLVRCEVHLDAEHLSFYALRRSAPGHQPLLRQVPYALPARRFHE